MSQAADFRSLPFHNQAAAKDGNAMWTDHGEGGDSHTSRRQAECIGRRQALAFLVAAGAWPVAARGQQSGRVRRIGMLETTSLQLNAANLDGLRQGLRALGYEEDKTFTIEYRSADGSEERFRELAAELIGSGVDSFVARGSRPSWRRE